jgi:hypothetical protein
MVWISHCSEKKEAQISINGPVYHVDLLTSETYTTQASDFIKGFSLVHLQEPDTNQLLKRVSQIVAHQHHWAVLDPAAPSVRLYDTLGRFVRTFGQVGEGPGEFVNLRNRSNLCLSPDSSELWLFANSLQSLLRYDLASGAYKSSLRVEFYPKACWPLPNGDLLFYNGWSESDAAGNYDLIQTSHTGEIKQRYSPFVTIGTGYPDTGFLRQGYFAPCFSDSVFQITGTGPELRYVFHLADAANKSLPYGTLGKNFLGHLFWDNGRFCFFYSLIDRKVTYCFYDRKSNKVFKFPNVPELDFYWIQHGRPVGLDASGRNFLISFEAESLPAVEAFCRQLQLPLIGPGLAQPPQTGHLIMTLHMR